MQTLGQAGDRRVLGVDETDFHQGGFGDEHIEHAELHRWSCPD